MRVLVTGGTGVVGRAAVAELLKRGHTVRLVSRNADADARQWPPDSGAEAWPASVSEQTELKGCADVCDLALHVAGIVEESPPNVDGLQAQTWESLAEAMVQESGETAHGAVQSEEEDLGEDRAGRVDDWLKALIAERKRSQHSVPGAPRREQGKPETADRSVGAEAAM